MGSAAATGIAGDGMTDWNARAGELLEENRVLSEAIRRLVEEIEAVRSRNRDLTRRLNTT
jgi:hypothetical protein